MRKSCFAFMAAVLVVTGLATAAGAQGFQSVYSKNGNDVWAVGDAGTAWRSFDGGATWLSQTLGAKPLHGVAHQGLVVMVISDDAELRRSTDNGGTFTLQTLAGASHLRAIEMADASTGWIVGDAGAIYKTTDGGASWSPQTSGTAQRLNAVRCRSASEGWAVGAAGTVLHTTDGGTNWTPVTVGSARNLRAVDYLGSTVWIVGDYATAVATNDGTVWTPVSLKLDSKVNVSGVWIESLSNITLTGGGGFLRKTTDGGATWAFQKNPVLAESADFFYTNGGTKGWVAHATNRSISRSADSGATWTSTGTVTRAFNLKQTLVSGSVRGNSLCVSGVDNNTIFVVLATTLYRSTNRGETWTQIGTISGGGTKTNAFYVHPADDNLMVVAIGAPDRIMRSTNGGATWTQTLAVDFTEYGVPLEMNGDVPNNLIFGPEDGKLYSSSDFGATWTTISTPGFRSPCDIQIVQDNNSVIWIGDGVTGIGSGQMFRSTNGGLTFSLIYTAASSEIPMIAGTHLNPNAGFSTHWSAGGCRRTTDMGANWPQVATTGSAWGCDYADDDPNVMAYGVYSGGLDYLSLDAGASGTFVTTAVTGSNYSLYMPDRATIFSLQSGGVYKMAFTHTVSATATQGPLAVVSPNGGEVWNAGDVHAITWTSSNLGLAKIEFRRSPVDAWQQVALVDGQAGSYNWTVPADNTTQAEVRVSDAWDANPSDTSNLAFSIQAPQINAAATLDFGPHAVGTLNTLSVTVQNTGGVAFTGSAAVSGAGFALVGSPALSIPAASSVNVDVEFSPGAVQLYTGSLDVTGNAAPTTTALAGEGTQAAALQLDAPNGGEAWQYGSSQSIQWSSVVVGQVRIEYQTAPAGAWTLIADNVPAAPNTYSWSIPYAPTATARVRVSQVSGGLADQSDLDFAITVPFFSASTTHIDFGLVNVGSSAQQTLTLTNPGTAPLSITAISSDNPEVAPAVTSMSIPAAGNANLNVTYSPSAPGADTATLTFVDDAPGSPHTVGAVGEGQTPSDVGNLPTTYGLAHDGPNPFRDVTSIRYRLPKTSAVLLEVFDLQGRRVATLVQGEQSPGEYSVTFGSGQVTAGGGRIGDLAAGVYFLRLKAGSYSKTAKIVLAR